MTFRSWKIRYLWFEDSKCSKPLSALEQSLPKLLHVTDSYIIRYECRRTTWKHCTFKKNRSPNEPKNKFLVYSKHTNAVCLIFLLIVGLLVILIAKILFIRKRQNETVHPLSYYSESNSSDDDNYI